MSEQTERLLINKINTLETIVKVLLDDLIDNDIVDFDNIMNRLDDIEKEQEAEQEHIISTMYYGPKGEA